jgi:hypothetical protein
MSSYIIMMHTVRKQRRGSLGTAVERCGENGGRGWLTGPSLFRLQAAKQTAACPYQGGIDSQLPALGSLPICCAGVLQLACLAHDNNDG